MSQPLNISTKNSLFDFPYAFAKGLLRLIDPKSDKSVGLRFIDNSRRASKAPTLITLPTRTSKLSKFKHDYVMPLHLDTSVKEALTPGHRYRLELGSLDLGVRWWCYGNVDGLEPQAFPQSEPTKLQASKPSHRDFLAVKNLPQPPCISISMSLSSNIIHRSRPSPLALCVTITNKEKHPITLRSTGDQSFIHQINGYENGFENTPNHNRITSIYPPPSRSNFSLTRVSTGGEFFPEPGFTCSLKVGTGEYSRDGLTTLEPNVPLVNEFVLLEDPIAFTEKKGGGAEFRLRLRQLGV